MHFLEFFYLRTPLLSIQQVLTQLEGDKLASLSQESRVGDAIFLASPTLFTLIQSDPALTNTKLRESVLKYVLRMGSRSTPFGQFAGCSLGEVAKASVLSFLTHKPTTHYRLDSQILAELISLVNHHPDLNDFISYKPNSSLYLIGNKYRYLESGSSDNLAPYFTTQIDAIPIIKLIVAKAKVGATRSQLLEALTSNGFPQTVSDQLLENLIVDQVLISDLGLSLTGLDPLSNLIESLRAMPTITRLTDQLQNLQAALTSASKAQLIDRHIRQLIERDFGIKFTDKSILQGDSLFTDVKLTLSRFRYKQLEQAIEEIFSLDAMHSIPEALQQFKQEFYARYEEREVPLSLALDSDSGIGYGSTAQMGDISLIDVLLESSNQSETTPRVQSPLDTWLLGLFDKWVTNPSASLELNDGDLAALPGKPDKLPDSYFAFGFLLANSEADLDNGNFHFRCKGISGPSAFPLLGRFGQVDEELRSKMQKASGMLQALRPHQIIAEIVHLPTAQTGNVVQRPQLSEFEIPYLGHSSLPTNQQIPIEDLLISVPGGKRVVLRSKRLKKEVLPRLSTAHNYNTGLPVYNFLCDLQHQESSLTVQWKWGILSHFRRLPRVQYQQIILKEARWRLDWADYTALISIEENIWRWRNEWRWPRLIALVQGDQELLIDLDSPPCQLLLISTLRRLKQIFLIEWLQTPEHCLIQGPEGPLTHELILPFFRNNPPELTDSSEYIPNQIIRTFVPGSEWLYLKVYCGPQTASEVLLAIGKLARSWVRTKVISHWFFVRYEDPKPHLRIRFHLAGRDNPDGHIIRCKQALNRLIVSGEVYQIQLDTYHREIERYGEGRIIATEWIFWADSDAILAINKQRPDEMTRFAIALQCVDSLLSLFGFDIRRKVAFFQVGFDAYFEEHQGNAETRKNLAKQYRKNLGLLHGEFTINWTIRLSAPYMGIVKQWRTRINKICQEYLDKNDCPAHFIQSLIHLFVNRLFEHHQRSYELLVYHHLLRNNQSRQAHPRNKPGA